METLQSLQPRPVIVKKENEDQEPGSPDDCNDCPVEYVSWNQAQDFLQKLNDQHPGFNYRLPTEAEWEYAARGGNQSKGYLYAGSNEVSQIGWNITNAAGKARPTGKKKANELGLYDMSGNVGELCSDLYADNYYKKSPASNPSGSNFGNYYVMRGGSWRDDANACRIANRSFQAGGAGYIATGLRLVR